MRFIAALFGILMVAAALPAQTVSPLSAEYGKKAAGTFTVTNNSLQPMVVTLEAVSVNVNPDGSQTLVQLDPNIHVQLDSMSAKLGPKSDRLFSYKATCTTLPCVFVIYSRFQSARHVDSGMPIVINLPTRVFICEKAKGCELMVRKTLNVPIQ